MSYLMIADNEDEDNKEKKKIPEQDVIKHPETKKELDLKQSDNPNPNVPPKKPDDKKKTPDEYYDEMTKDG